MKIRIKGFTSALLSLLLFASAAQAAVYGTLSGETNMVVAPPTVVCGGVVRVTAHLGEAEANALGYRLVVDAPPVCESNQYAIAVGWADGGVRIMRAYLVREIAATPRRWTPLSIKRAAARLGYWEQLKAFLVEADAYDDFCMAQYEAEDDADFVRLMAAARQVLGNAAVDAVLNSAEVEP